MTIRYKCEECGAALNINDELAGTKGSCPRCQVEFVVPAPEGIAVVKHIPKAGLAEPGADVKKRVPGEPLSDDDITSFLEEGSSSKAAYRPAESSDDDTSDEEDDEIEEKPRKRRAKARLDDTEDESTDENGDDDDAAARRKIKEKKSKKSPVGKSDSAESAAIAKNLMARGDRAAPRDEKTGGRPFGGSDGTREDGEEGSSFKEIVIYLCTKGLPYVVGAVVLVGLCYWLSSQTFSAVELPPLYSVTGTVTLDGKPLEGAVVAFQPKTEGAKPNLKLGMSVGKTNKEGKYTLSYALIDGKTYYGAVAGPHYVTIRVDDPATQVEMLPPHYSSISTTRLSFEVKQDGKQPANFDLTLKKEPESQ